MIFVTLGMQKFPFDRLLKALDELKGSGELEEAVFAQTGFSTFHPEHFPSVSYLTEEEFRRKLEECQMVIAHGGAGAIIAALNAKKPIIVCPRKKVFGEHVDDHQFELAKAFADQGLVLLCENETELLSAIRSAEEFAFKDYEPGPSEVLDFIEHFIENEERA